MTDRTNRREQQNAGRKAKRRPVHGRSLAHVLNAIARRARD